jgi:tetratricopeptide (TPR) repeat protein
LSSKITNAIGRASIISEPEWLKVPVNSVLQSKVPVTSVRACADHYCGRLRDAALLLEDIIRRCESNRLGDHKLNLDSRNELALVYESLERWPEAETLRRETLRRRRYLASEKSPFLAYDLAAFGRHLIARKRFTEAETALREALAVHETADLDNWRHFNAMSVLGSALLGQGRHAEAEPWVIGGYEGLKARERRIPATDLGLLYESELRVVQLYQSSGQPEKAAAWSARLGLADLPVNVFARP